MSSEEQQPKVDSETSFKLAITMALLRSKLLQKPPDRPPSSSSTSESDAQKWKQKAKARKEEIRRLKDDLKQAEDMSQNDLFPQTASCKCYFFDNLGKLSPNQFRSGSDQRFNDVLRRRFLRQVRLDERKRRRSNSSTKDHPSYDCNTDDEIEQLRTSADFLVQLCETISPLKVEEMNFANWSHQAVDFILGTLKSILSEGKDAKVEGIISSLIIRLVRRMCSPVEGNELHQLDTDAEFCIQHLIRKLGSEPHIGQRVMLSVSQRIIVLAESFLFTDPFDDAFPIMHDCMYMMIQLIEFLVSDYLLTWSSNGRFDTRLFEEWVASVLHAKKSLELLESRNALYVLYMDRVIGVLGKQVGQISLLQNLNPDILANLLR